MYLTDKEMDVLCGHPVPSIIQVRHLVAEVRQLRRDHDAQVDRLKACEHIACADEGWRRLRNECPSAAAVAALRDAFEQKKANESELAYARERAEMAEDALRVLLPMAKGYAASHPVGNNAAMIAEIEGRLSITTDSASG